MTQVKILDDVLIQIDQDYLSKPPELGAGLMGPRGHNLISHLVPDPQAKTTSVSYEPSRKLTNEIKNLEEYLRLRGIFHTHPGSLDTWSSLDEATFKLLLDINPHLAKLIFPIGTMEGFQDGELGVHEVRIKNGKLTFYVARQTRNGGITIRKAPVKVLPVSEDTAKVAAQLGDKSVDDLGTVEIECELYFVRKIDLAGVLDLTIMFGTDYPVTAPIAMLGGDDVETKQLHLDWSIEEKAENRLLSSFEKHVHIEPRSGNKKFKIAWGPRPNLPLTDDWKTAGATDWQPILTNLDVQRETRKRNAAVLKRTLGILPKSIENSRVLMTGLGSAGSYMGIQFVRSGISMLEFWDFDTVSLTNLSRASYTLADVGDFKVDALRRQLLMINPELDITTRASAIQDLDMDYLDEAVRKSDIVVNAADDPGAAHILSRIAYHRGKPFVSIGLYAKAAGGEVVFAVPNRTPCFSCATAFRKSLERETEMVGKKTNYATGRLESEPALSSDIHHVSSAAVKISLSLLMQQMKHKSLYDFANDAIRRSSTYVMFGMEQDYWFLPTIFQDVAGQHAYQSVWAEFKRDPDCPVCGDRPIDPTTIPLKGPSVAALQQAMENGPKNLTTDTKS